MWWLAWRQHRLAVAVALAVLVILAGALLIFRAQMIGALHSLGCSVADQQVCHNKPEYWTVMDPIESRWHIVRIALIVAPIVLGVFVGAPIFPREFDQRTDVFALTQSVGRLRWWASKVAVAGVPLVAGLIGLGYFAGWVDNSFQDTARSELDDGTFHVHSIVPAVLGLLALAIAVTAGIVVRSVVGSLVTGLIIAAGAVMLIAFPLRSHLLPVTRDLTPIADLQPYGPGADAISSAGADEPSSWLLGSGFVDTAGHAMAPLAAACDTPPPSGEHPSAQAIRAANEAVEQCRRDKGIAAWYTDYLPASMLWPMRGIVAGVCVLLAALSLAAGALRLRVRGGSRN